MTHEEDQLVQMLVDLQKFAGRQPLEILDNCIECGRARVQNAVGIICLRDEVIAEAQLKIMED